MGAQQARSSAANQTSSSAPSDMAWSTKDVEIAPKGPSPAAAFASCGCGEGVRRMAALHTKKSVSVGNCAEKDTCLVVSSGKSRDKSDLAACKLAGPPTRSLTSSLQSNNARGRSRGSSIAASCYGDQLTDEQVADLKEAFSYHDANHDGSITREQFGNVMQDLDLDPSDMELEEFEACFNEDGISFDDFLTAMSASRKGWKQDVRAAFDELDRDQNGYITALEMRATLSSMGVEDSDVNQALLDFRKADANGDGKLNFKEFVRMQRRNRAPTEPAVPEQVVAPVATDADANLRSVFESWDSDQDGVITVTEAQAALNKMGGTFTIAEVDAMLRDADIDGDGQLNFREFVGMMRSSQQ